MSPMAALEGEVGVAGEVAPDRSGGLIVNCLGDPYGTLFQLRHCCANTHFSTGPAIISRVGP